MYSYNIIVLMFFFAAIDHAKNDEEDGAWSNFCVLSKCLQKRLAEGRSKAHSCNLCAYPASGPDGCDIPGDRPVQECDQFFWTRKFAMMCTKGETLQLKYCTCKCIQSNVLECGDGCRDKRMDIPTSGPSKLKLAFRKIFLNKRNTI